MGSSSLQSRGAYEQRKGAHTKASDGSLQKRGTHQHDLAEFGPVATLVLQMAETVPEWPGGLVRRTVALPRQQPHWTTAVLEEQVKFVRLELYNQAVFCGAQAIRWRLEELAVEPLPSLSTIGRILLRHDLTDRRTGRYEPKGVYYPRVEVQHAERSAPVGFRRPLFLERRTPVLQFE